MDRYCPFDSLLLSIRQLIHIDAYERGRVVQSVARPIQEPEVPGSIPHPANLFSFFLPLIQQGLLSVIGASMFS